MTVLHIFRFRSKLGIVLHAVVCFYAYVHHELEDVRQSPWKFGRSRQIIRQAGSPLCVHRVRQTRVVLVARRLYGPCGRSWPSVANCGRRSCLKDSSEAHQAVRQKHAHVARRGMACHPACSRISRSPRWCRRGFRAAGLSELALDVLGRQLVLGIVEDLLRGAVLDQIAQVYECRIV